MLTLVRYMVENKHGYVYGPHYRMTASIEDSRTVLSQCRAGHGSVKGIKILDTATIPQPIQRSGFSDTARAYACLGGAEWLRFTAAEMVGIISQAIESHEVHEVGERYRATR